MLQIPNVEGKAGMAAIVDEQKQLNIALLQEGIKNSLPSYARPLFLRVIEHVPMTGTSCKAISFLFKLVWVLRQ